MYRFINYRSRFKSLTIAAVLIILATFAINVPLTSAKSIKGSGKGLHTPVSSDGVVPDASTAEVVQGQREQYVLPSSGTNSVTTINKQPINDARVAPVAVPSGPQQPESVIGTDSRVRITATTSYPYRAIVHITSSIGGCTGWLINANTVVTAGHCVYGGGWASNVVVYPGRNGNSAPYGSCKAIRLFSVTGWTRDQNRNYDYGAIKLNCSIGNTTGWFGYRWQSASMNGQPTYIAGYPGDKTYGTLWRHDEQVRLSYAQRLYYANDTAPGQSGSPVWNNNANCSNCAIAIHTYGVDSTGYNGGTRITSEVFTNLTAWRNS